MKKNKNKEISFEDIWYGCLEVVLILLSLLFVGLVGYLGYSVVQDIIVNGISVKMGISGGVTAVFITAIIVMNVVGRMGSHGCTYGNWYQ